MVWPPGTHCGGRDCFSREPFSKNGKLCMVQPTRLDLPLGSRTKFARESYRNKSCASSHMRSNAHIAVCNGREEATKRKTESAPCPTFITAGKPSYTLEATWSERKSVAATWRFRSKKRHCRKSRGSGELCAVGYWSHLLHALAKTVSPSRTTSTDASANNVHHINSCISWRQCKNSVNQVRHRCRKNEY